MRPQDAIQQVVDSNVQSTVSVGSAASGWAAHLAGLNEVLITVATLIAIASGAWALWDKVKATRGRKRDEGNSR